MKEAPLGLVMGLHRAEPPLSVGEGQRKTPKVLRGGTWGCFIKQRPPCLVPAMWPEQANATTGTLGTHGAEVPVGLAPVSPSAGGGCGGAGERGTMLSPASPQQTWAELPPPASSCAGGARGMPHPPPPPADAKRGKKGNFSPADPIALKTGRVPYPSHATSALQWDFQWDGSTR